MPIWIDRPAMVEGRLEFLAKNASGEFRISVSIDLWERLQAQSPLVYDLEDRRDHALSMIEQLAEAAPRRRHADRLVAYLD